MQTGQPQWMCLFLWAMHQKCQNAPSLRPENRCIYIYHHDDFNETSIHRLRVESESDPEPENEEKYY